MTPSLIEIVPSGFAVLDENEHGEMQVYTVLEDVALVSKNRLYITQGSLNTLVESVEAQGIV